MGLDFDYINIRGKECFRIACFMTALEKSTWHLFIVGGGVLFSLERWVFGFAIQFLIDN